jgi:NAD(P)-dependent dehydrogenase (short-subunit alcohol dehydrogenase family)
MLELKGKVVIVTGGARGIGREICLGAASEGATVVAADINFSGAQETCRQIRRKKGRCLALRVDVSSERETEEMASTVQRKFGRIDALVNDAAYFYGLKLQPFTEVDPAEWDRLMQVNVKGTWLCSKAVFPYMKRQGRGKIVNISSSTFFSGVVGFPHYVASKGAIIALTRALAKEVGEYNVNVNSVAPGYTDTEAQFTMHRPENSMVEAKNRAIKRPEVPKDVVGAVLFLCSDYADFVTGQTILVDGGFALH